jgi:hypothetical protein
MKFKFLNQFLIGLSVLLATSANAGLITDTSSDSFIDNTTGLEWMDFGVNNIHTYSEVENLMSSTYQSWTLASQSQVIALFDNAFGNFAYQPSTSELYRAASNNDVSNTNMLAVMDRMGYGSTLDSISHGWFEDDQGGLSYLYTRHITAGRGTGQLAYVSGLGVDWNSYRNNTNNNYSTMLVRQANHVPEPSTLAIFALGMIGLASRRFKKQS